MFARKGHASVRAHYRQKFPRSFGSKTKASKTPLIGLEVSDQKSGVRKMKDLQAALAQFAAVTAAKQRPGFPIDS